MTIELNFQSIEIQAETNGTKEMILPRGAERNTTKRRSNNV
jgi:hypothetical protein